MLRNRNIRALILLSIILGVLSCGHPPDTSNYPLDTSCLQMTILDTVVEFSCVDTLKLRLSVTRCDSTPIRMPLIGPVFRLVRSAEVPGDSGFKGIADFLDPPPLMPAEKSGPLPFQTIMPGETVGATAEFLCTKGAVSSWSIAFRILYEVTIDYPDDKRRYKLLSSNSVNVAIIAPRK